MCLLNNETRLKVAERDIPCMKVITIDLGDFRPFYRRELTIPHEVVCGKTPYKADGEAVCVEREDACHPCVWGGGLVHTYNAKANLITFEYSNALIYKCVIPKGTEYTEGVDERGGKCYASREIVFGEKVFDGREVCWQYYR